MPCTELTWHISRPPQFANPAEHPDTDIEVLAVPPTPVSHALQERVRPSDVQPAHVLLYVPDGKGAEHVPWMHWRPLSQLSDVLTLQSLSMLSHLISVGPGERSPTQEAQIPAKHVWVPGPHCALQSRRSPVWQATH